MNTSLILLLCNKALVCIGPLYAPQCVWMRNWINPRILDFGQNTCILHVLYSRWAYNSDMKKRKYKMWLKVSPWIVLQQTPFERSIIWKPTQVFDVPFCGLISRFSVNKVLYTVDWPELAGVLFILFLQWLNLVAEPDHSSVAWPHPVVSLGVNKHHLSRHTPTPPERRQEQRDGITIFTEMDPR